MMTSKQGQSVSDNSIAIQAARDVNYSAGISSGQMVEIISSVQNLVQVFTEQSKDVMEQRLQDFRDSLIEEFSEGGKGIAKAFTDPDFQGALLDAQKAIARSGDKSLESVLVDLVSRKSTCEIRDRLSLTLNDAISKAGSLTNEDFDLLALVFMFKNMMMKDVPNLKVFLEKFEAIFGPTAANAAEGELAISYLESHGCLRTTFGGPGSFIGGFQVLVKIYPGTLTKGVDRESLEKIFPTDSPPWVRDLVHHSQFGDDLFLVMPGDADMIDQVYENAKLPERPGKLYADLVRNHPMTSKDFFKTAALHFEGTQRVVEKYDSSGAREAKLTPVGLTLAHARLTALEDFDAPLEIWFK